MVKTSVNATQKIQDKILKTALEDVPFDGLSWDTIIKASEKCGYDEDVAASVFPNEVTSFLQCFSEWADNKMLEELQGTNTDAMRVRDRVRLAVWVRLELLKPYKEVVRMSLSHWINPIKKPRAVKIVWSTSDKIWDWAGDVSKDYNKYTKRGLLSGVITATTLVWINDKSDEFQKTSDFLDRRIDNVLVVGKLAGKILGKKKA